MAVAPEHPEGLTLKDVVGFFAATFITGTALAITILSVLNLLSIGSALAAVVIALILSGGIAGYMYYSAGHRKG